MCIVRLSLECDWPWGWKMWEMANFVNSGTSGRFLVGVYDLPVWPDRSTANVLEDCMIPRYSQKIRVSIFLNETFISIYSRLSCYRWCHSRDHNWNRTTWRKHSCYHFDLTKRSALQNKLAHHLRTYRVLFVPFVAWPNRKKYNAAATGRWKHVPAFSRREVCFRFVMMIVFPLWNEDPADTDYFISTSLQEHLPLFLRCELRHKMNL